MGKPIFQRWSLSQGDLNHGSGFKMSLVFALFLK